MRLIKLLDAENHGGVLKESWRLVNLARELFANPLGVRARQLHDRHGQHAPLEGKCHLCPVHFKAHCRTLLGCCQVVRLKLSDSPLSCNWRYAQPVCPAYFALRLHSVAAAHFSLGSV